MARCPEEIVGGKKKGGCLNAAFWDREKKGRNECVCQIFKETVFFHLSKPERTSFDYFICFSKWIKQKTPIYLN